MCSDLSGQLLIQSLQTVLVRQANNRLVYYTYFLLMFMIENCFVSSYNCNVHYYICQAW